MGPRLIARWLAEKSAVAIRDEAAIALVREQARAQAAAAGLDRAAGEALAIIASELGHNQLAHAERGEIAVQRIDRDGVLGVEIVAPDAGPGIDPARAFSSEPRAQGGLGAGLSGVVRLADEVDFDVRLGAGSCLRARKFAAPVARREICILGRACEGEIVSGDDALAIWQGGALVLAVADGLGHGEPAHEAADLAMDAVRASAAEPIEQILNRCDEALEGTRGAALSIARIEPDQLCHGGVGNVSLHAYAQIRVPTAHFTGKPGVVGDRRGLPRLQIEALPLPERRLIAMFTDGLSSQLDVAADLRAFSDPPLLVAHRLMLAYGKLHDDALIALAR